MHTKKIYKKNKAKNVDFILKLIDTLYFVDDLQKAHVMHWLSFMQIE